MTFTQLHNETTISIHNMWLDAGKYQREFLEAFMMLHRGEEFGALESERARHDRRN